MESEAEAVRVEPNFAALGGPMVPGKWQRFGERMARKAAGWKVTRQRLEARECVLPLDQLRGLLEATEDTQGAGVYFMWLRSRLVYIGQSNCIAYRLDQHIWKPRTRVTWLRVDDETWRKIYEAGYVRHYAPPFNRTRHG
jgi:hypothetical protein